MGNEKFYNSSFYNDQMAGSLTSARCVLSELFRYYKPESVVDFGCGRGTWLSATHSLGAKKLLGLDGFWVKPEEFIDSSIEFMPVDFEEEILFEKKYDLAISVEVAEHISESGAQSFVNSICNSADVVVFGAAIVRQGGVNHVNEQWQSYWMDLFAQKGFKCYDLFRPVLWHNKSVEWFYRQNTFVYTCSPELMVVLDSVVALNPPIADVVHPENLQHQFAKMADSIENPGSSLVKQVLKNYLKRKFGIKKRVTLD